MVTVQVNTWRTNMAVAIGFIAGVFIGLMFGLALAMEADNHDH